MSTLADILRDVKSPEPLKQEAGAIQARQHVRQWLKDTPVIVINEVAQYFFDVFWRDDKPLKDSDFPNVAPPFPCFWMEYRVPRTITSGKPSKQVRMELAGQRVGFYWLGLDRANSDDGWSLTSLMFVEDEGWAVGPVFSARVDTDAQGRAIDLLYQNFIPDDASVSEEERDFVRVNMMTLHYPAALAICFMHCSNVEVVERHAKETHRLRHQRLYGRPPLISKTLNITPMRRIITSKGGADCSLEQALHIMRGHFKRFEEKPLFGKHRGMWWWSSQVRGSLEHGYVKKTYEVHPPKKD